MRNSGRIFNPEPVGAGLTMRSKLQSQTDNTTKRFGVSLFHPDRRATFTRSGAGMKPAVVKRIPGGAAPRSCRLLKVPQRGSVDTAAQA